MIAAPVEPGRLLGMLGGGQLGAMFAAAARRLGYRVAVWDPDPQAPALRLADRPVCGPFTDPQLADIFAADLAAVTYEWENISPDLADWLAGRVPVRPAPQVLRLLQNRLAQKRFLAEHGFPVAPFRALQHPEDLYQAGDVGFPCLCKTVTAGYDGKGQWRLSEVGEVADLVQGLRDRAGPWVLEQYLRFDKELSAVVVHGANGERRLYPVAENDHEDGILRVSSVPARIPARLAERAAALADAVVSAVNGIGVFCVEMFLMPDGQLYVNEIAPRPHNSGHYTLDACTVSQFEQQVRAVCALPLGEVRLLASAVMVNLLGEEVRRLLEPAALQALLATPGACLHLYGKREVRPRRKMGHVTYVGTEPQVLRERARRLLQGMAERQTPA